MWAILGASISGDIQDLEKHSKKAGAWPEWRSGRWPRSGCGLRRPRKGTRSGPPRWLQADDNHSVLWRSLYEGRAEDAWREAGWEDARIACGFGWPQPGEGNRRRRTYLFEVCEAGVAATSTAGTRPVNLLAKAAAVMKRLDRNAEFVPIWKRCARNTRSSATS